MTAPWNPEADSAGFHGESVLKQEKKEKEKGRYDTGGYFKRA